MRVKLKNSGSYGGLASVKFPADVEARPTKLGHGFRVYGSELQVLAGCEGDSFSFYNTYFFHNDEVEVIL